MRYVRQKHKNGCGVASLAMAVGISYDNAMRVIAPNREPGSEFRGTTLEHLLRALDILGVKYKLRFDNPNLSTLKNHCYISAGLACGCRHAVVWDAKNKKIMDPDPVDEDHHGKKVVFSRRFIKKNQNYIVEIIPS